MAITSKKNQYALRAIFELAKHSGKGPTKISEIARTQAIPARFLEVILGQLKGSGLVESKRGFYGGYYLIRSPDEITVGDIFRFMESPSNGAECLACVSKANCPFDGNCAFSSMWRQVKDAIYQIYDATTIQDLLNHEKQRITARTGVQNLSGEATRI
ncbi:MAG: Rrf2 family transcriptional regulator [Desulfobacterales bacterium]|nr:MAG: Rrf2 family transcriptional regulator [Desulfobacterales bacterium]